MAKLYFVRDAPMTELCGTGRDAPMAELHGTRRDAPMAEPSSGISPWLSHKACPNG